MCRSAGTTRMRFPLTYWAQMGAPPPLTSSGSHRLLNPPKKKKRVPLTPPHAPPPSLTPLQAVGSCTCYVHRAAAVVRGERGRVASGQKLPLCCLGWMHAAPPSPPGWWGSTGRGRGPSWMGERKSAHEQECGRLRKGNRATVLCVCGGGEGKFMWGGPSWHVNSEGRDRHVSAGRHTMCHLTSVARTSLLVVSFHTSTLPPTSPLTPPLPPLCAQVRLSCVVRRIP